MGQSTLFVRLGGCDLRCRWCDSPHTWRAAARCRIETKRGSAQFRELPNPVAQEDVLAAVDALEWRSHRFVSLTGGEPLLQREITALTRKLHAAGHHVTVETAGTVHADIVDDGAGDDRPCTRAA